MIILLDYRLRGNDVKFFFPTYDETSVHFAKILLLNHKEGDDTEFRN